MIKVSKIIFILFIFFSCKKNENNTPQPQIVGEQDSLATISFNVYNSSNSPLNSDIINDVFIDSQNNKWFATDDGLYRLNSTSNWSIFSKNNTELESDIVNVIIEDNNNLIWVGTDKGLASFDGENWVNYIKDDFNLPTSKVRKLAADNNNNLWVGTFNGGGLAKYNGNEWENYS